MTEMAHKPSLGTKLAYGFGASAYGIKDNGFGYFLLLFYGTVVGLEPGLVGLAIFIALIFDALSDPVVGYVSDNWHSKWGRRHPFMYAAALPVAVSYFLLWNPPDWSNTALFWYLLVLAILIRTFITFYETPSSALMPEITRDYDERASVQAYRLFFGWTGGNFMSVLMFAVLLVPTAVYENGLLNREAYATYGVIASFLIFAAIMVSALGTHEQIKYLRKPTPKHGVTLGKIFLEIAQTLRNKNFGALFTATIFGEFAAGLSGGLAFLMLTYFWGFSTSQIFLWTVLVFLSAIIGFGLAPQMARRLGKKQAVIAIGCVAFTMMPMPVILRLLDLLPVNGDPMLFPIVVCVNTIGLGLIIALQAVLYSMVADLVEHEEMKTGRRSEGVLFAAITFTRKANHGFGALAAGTILSIIAFPQGASSTDVPPETLWALGAWLAPSQILLWAAMIVAVRHYKIERSDHEENLRHLKNQELKNKAEIASEIV